MEMRLEIRSTALFGALFTVWLLGLLAGCGPGDRASSKPELRSVEATPLSRTLPAPTPTPVPSTIYLNEKYKGRPFESAAEWTEKVRSWEARRPESSGILSTLARIFERATARRVASRVVRQLSQGPEIANDKWLHCIMGAEIAVATTPATAEYAGWLKERRDLTDGRPDTSFDEDDYEATVDGAFDSPAGGRYEANQEVCEERWGDRYSDWDGTTPP